MDVFGYTGGDFSSKTTKGKITIIIVLLLLAAVFIIPVVYYAKKYSEDFGSIYAGRYIRHF